MFVVVRRRAGRHRENAILLDSRVLRRGVLIAAIAPVLASAVACGSSASPAQQADDLVTAGLKAQLSGDLATAQSDYNQALKLDDNKYAHFDLGTIYEAQADKVRAIAEYHDALAVDPNFVSALFNLAVDTAANDPRGAEQLYRKVVALQPTDADAWLNLGFVLMNEGNSTAARAEWAQATALDASLASRIPGAAASASPAASPGASPSAR